MVCRQNVEWLIGKIGSHEPPQSLNDGNNCVDVKVRRQEWVGYTGAQSSILSTLDKVGRICPTELTDLLRKSHAYRGDRRCAAPSGPCVLPTPRLPLDGTGTTGCRAEPGKVSFPGRRYDDNLREREREREIYLYYILKYYVHLRIKITYSFYSLPKFASATSQRCVGTCHIGIILHLRKQYYYYYYYYHT